jgi:two-component system, NarL family, sensor histidine kinase UhpB
LPSSLFWRVFLVNAALATAAVALLAVTPLTVSNPATSRQLAVLAAGLFALLVANALLLRVSLRPLRWLTQLMERIDLLQPGERLEVAGARELNALLSAFNDMLERLERERRTNSKRVIGREEDERRQLASELHDQVGQGLTALLLQLKSAAAEASPAVQREILEAQAMARDNLDEVRRIARRLRPTVLDDLGLPYALLALADAAQDQYGVTLLRAIDTTTPRVSEQAELALYRIAQEAVTNAVRHARADSIELVLRSDARGGVRLAVHDDGRGMLFAPEVEGGGIRGMRERAVAVGADLTIATQPGAGTRVSVELRP